MKQRVDELAERIDAPASLLPTYGRSEHMARPYIESADDMFSYVVVERGIRLRHEATTDLDELLYWIFRSVTFDMSTKFEVQNRAEDQDFRIIQCRHQLALVARLKPHWDRRYTSEKRDRLGGLGIEIDPTIRSCVARLIWLSCHFCGVRCGREEGWFDAPVDDDRLHAEPCERLIDAVCTGSAAWSGSCQRVPAAASPER